MLVLTRREGQSIHVGNDIVITVLATQKGRTKIGINAPGQVRVDRHEVRQRLPVIGDEPRLAEPAVPSS